jgi:hypothetical protein
MASIMQEKTQILESSIDQSNDVLNDVIPVNRSDEEIDIDQWNLEFGLQSGTTYALYLFFALSLFIHLRALKKISPSLHRHLDHRSR